MVLNQAHNLGQRTNNLYPDFCTRSARRSIGPYVKPSRAALIARMELLCDQPNRIAEKLSALLELNAIVFFFHLSEAPTRPSRAAGGEELCACLEEETFVYTVLHLVESPTLVTASVIVWRTCWCLT